MDRLPRIPEASQTASHGSSCDESSDAGRFEVLWAAAAEQVAVFLRATVFSRTDRQDLGQAVAQKAWAAFSTYRPDLGSFSAWVLGIARNEYLHHVRAHRRTRVLFDSELAERAVTQLCQFETPPSDEWQAALRQELASLPAESRELLRLKYEEGLTCGEIAARVGQREDAVRMRLHRVRTAVKDSLSRKLGESI